MKKLYIRARVQIRYWRNRYRLIQRWYDYGKGKWRYALHERFRKPAEAEPKYLGIIERISLAQKLGLPADKCVFYFDTDSKDPRVYYHDNLGRTHNLQVDFSKFESWLAKQTKPQSDDERLKKQGRKIGELTQKLKEHGIKA